MASIQGIGIDVIDMQRIRKTIDEMGDSFLRKLLTEAEVSYCRSKKAPHQHFAARFAVDAPPGFGVPRIVRESFLRQYPLGYELVAGLVERGGVAALTTALSDPPLSSEERG